jgi:hypothetical protein
MRFFDQLLAVALRHFSIQTARQRHVPAEAKASGQRKLIQRPAWCQPAGNCKRSGIR